jgi:hypothetical protein
MLQLSTDGDDWVLADSADLTSEPMSALHSDDQPPNTAPSKDDWPSRGTTLSCLHVAQQAAGAVHGQPTLKHACMDAQYYRIVARGFHPANQRNAIGISQVRPLVYSEAGEGAAQVVLPLPDSTNRAWLVFSASRSLQSICSLPAHKKMAASGETPAAANTLCLLALASGSPTAALEAVLWLARAARTESALTRTWLGSFTAVSQWRRRRANALSWWNALQENRAVSVPQFEATMKSAQISLQNNSSTAVCELHAAQAPSAAFVLGSIGFPLRGRHTWIFRYDQDRSGDE